MSPNQIDMNGAMLNVTVPGETRPRQLGEVTTARYAADQCWPAAQPEWFCAYQFAWGSGGDAIGMWACWNYGIPWYTTGSWINHQTPGTRPRLYFVGGGSRLMPPAPSAELSGVNWSVVKSITNC